MTGMVIAGLVGTAVAADFPTKPITLIVPWSAGGGSDTSMRLVADAVSKLMSQTVVVVNRPGAGGAIGTHAIVSAKPDGYTIGMVGSGVVARQYANPNADPITDLQAIAFFGPDPGLLSARADTGFKTVKDFVDYAKANPGKIKNGNDNPGGFSHIAISVMESKLGIKVTKVPYKGYAPTVAGLLAGEVQACTVPVSDVIDHQKAGKLNILGVAGTKRHFMAPDIPTFQEQGFDVVIGSWRALVAPKGIPKERLKYIEEKLLAAMRDPDFQKKAKNAGFNPVPLPAEETWKRIVTTDEMLYPVLLEAGMVKTRKK